MDLNEKLAARRRELAIESEKTAQVEAARARELAIQAEKARQAEKEAIQVEVERRLAEKGIAPSTPRVLSKPAATPTGLVDSSTTKINWSGAESTPPAISASAIDAEVEKAISKAASDRWTGGENATISILFLLGIGGFFIAWWVGLAFVVWALTYGSKTTARYKEQIIAEGNAKVAESKPKVTEEQIEWK